MSPRNFHAPAVRALNPSIPSRNVSSSLVRKSSSLCALFLALLVSARAQTARPIQLTVDLTDAPRKILHAQLSIPVQPGPLTLIYPKWIPGEHSPTGPVDNFVGLTITAAGEPLAWQRDDVNMFAFHLTIPGGVNTVEAKADFLATAGPTGFSAGASTSANLCVLSWNELIIYPATEFVSKVIVQPSVKLPDQWKAGTALTQSSVDGSTIHFAPVPVDMLIDSPVLAGRFFKEVPLAPDVSPKHFLDMAGDGPEDLKASDDVLKAFSQLITQADRLYKSHHYASYHFLLTLSDSVAHFGLEHHQSSDDRVSARTFLDDDLKLLSGDLLPHEFTHSWNGKYRRPVGLATPNYQQPMKGELLWVYEGLTQYLGDVLTARSGIWTADQYRSYLARSAAELDHRPGRVWRNLQDTATAAQTLYETSEQWDNLRRSVDYYPEGELIWLDVDTTMRKLSGGKNSLDDFCARFFGPAGNTGPSLIPYTFEDVVNALKATQDYDWAKFLNERLNSKAPHAPLGGILNGGYRLEYNGTPNEFDRAVESRDRGLDAWYSLGFRDSDTTIQDVLVGSPAYRAGLGPGMKIVAVDGRRATEELLREAIRNTKDNAQSLDLIVENTGFFKIVKIDYHGGEKYPHLVRVEKTPALLDEILKPVVTAPQTAKAD
jgi:predicted metalloprotease with PDZ domain